MLFKPKFLLGFMGFCWITATVRSAPAAAHTQHPISALQLIRGLVELLIDNNIGLSASVLEELGLLPTTTNTTPSDGTAIVQSTPATTTPKINALSIIRGLIEILYHNNIRISVTMLEELLSTTTSTTTTTTYICAHVATSPPCRFNSIQEMQTFNGRNNCQDYQILSGETQCSNVCTCVKPTTKDSK